MGMYKTYGNDEYNQLAYLYPKYKIDKKIRLIEFFGGYGTFSFALKYLGADYESYKLCEWAVKSIKAYHNAHHKDDNTDYSKDLTKEEIIDYLANKGISSNYNEPMSKEQVERLSEVNLRNIYNDIKATNNLVNIQQVKGSDLEIVDKDKYEYVLTYSYPCQDLSLSGERKGMSDTSTRSGMLWEVERILDELHESNSLPQVLIMENVQQVHDSTNREDFNRWLVRLEDLGYKNYYRDLQATDFNIPQLRTRCFMISILGDYSYTFPHPITNEKDLNVKSLLEKEVEDKYYLSEQFLEWSKKTTYHQSSYDFCTLKRISNTLTTAVHLFFKDPTNTTQDSNSENMRYLTPRESFRLMGIKDKDFDNIAINQSDTSLWHLAGDAIVCLVPMAIFGELLDINYVDIIKNWDFKN